VIWVDIITEVDLTIRVGIIIVHNIINNKSDIVTSPRTWASGNFEWTFTIDMTEFWADFVSPSVFTHDNTGVDFTGIKSTVSIFVTVFHEDIEMFKIDVITPIDLSITIGISGGHDFRGDHVDILTIPRTFTSLELPWAITIDMSVTWTVFVSPFIFVIV